MQSRASFATFFSVATFDMPRRAVVLFLGCLLAACGPGEESVTLSTASTQVAPSADASSYAASSVAKAGAQATTHLRIRQPSAGADAYFGNCPDLSDPPAGTVCRENFVSFFREMSVEGGGSNAPSEAPWAVYATTYTLTFDAPGTDPVVSDQIEGFLLYPSIATSDREHLSTATVAARVPMSDGTWFDFFGTWTAATDRFVYGNDGPANHGLQRHFNDKCNTTIYNVHQKFRFATMSGYLNGQAIQTYTFDFTAAIFHNQFVYIDVSKKGCP